MIGYLSEKIKFILFLYIYIFIPFNPLIANESKGHSVIDLLVNSCYKDIQYCDKALFKIYDYQKNASLKKKYSCQTRLLGLEANLIMAMNENFKRKDVESIIDDINKYC